MCYRCHCCKVGRIRRKLHARAQFATDSKPEMTSQKVTVVGAVDYNSNHIDVISRSVLLTDCPSHCVKPKFYYADFHRHTTDTQRTTHGRLLLCGHKRPESARGVPIPVNWSAVSSLLFRSCYKMSDVSLTSRCWHLCTLLLVEAMKIYVYVYKRLQLLFCYIVNTQLRLWLYYDDVYKCSVIKTRQNCLLNHGFVSVRIHQFCHWRRFEDAAIAPYLSGSVSRSALVYYL